MSHFTVLVVADDEMELEERLAPFQENNMGDCPEEYMEFFDCTDEIEEVWREGKIGAVVNEKTGEITHRSDSRFKVNKEVFPIAGRGDYVYPPEWVEREVTMPEFYDSKEDFIEQYFGYQWDEYKSAYGYWENPQAKWDWWVVGGRWSGLLRLKPKSVDQRMHGELVAPNGDSGLMSPANTDMFHASSLEVKDIDAEWHEQEHRRNAEQRWCAFHSDAWQEYLRYVENEEKAPPGVFKAAMNINQLAGLTWITEEHHEDLVELSMNKYIEKYGKSKALTYAVVDEEGEWRARGEMGWFGVTIENYDGYDEEFWKWFSALDPHTRLWVVDCHI